MIRLDVSPITSRGNLQKFLAHARPMFPEINGLRLDCQFSEQGDHQRTILGYDISAQREAEITKKASFAVKLAQSLANEGWRANRWHIWAPPGAPMSQIKAMMSEMMAIDDHTEFEVLRQPDVTALNADGYIDFRWFEHTALMVEQINITGAILCGHMRSLAGKVEESWRFANGESKLFKNEHAKALSEWLSFMAIDVYPSSLPSYIATEGAYVKRFQKEIFDRFRMASYDIARSVQLGEFNAVLPKGDGRLLWYRRSLVECVAEIERFGVLNTLHRPNDPLSILDGEAFPYIEAQ